ncbi:MAG: ABC transporter ATP-binding protein [Proteobacteria bacterium]|nr:ABC transporter ATP-binding protein [Pseudomonadota bacterium]
MIKIKELTIANKQRVLIANLNMHFNQGEFWAILGKNGSGKTTFLHTLAGFLSYKKGSIEINGKHLCELDAISKAQNIALLPQTLEASLDCTVEQSIGFGRYAWHKSTIQKQQDKQIIDYAIQSLELDSLRQRSIQKISGGELRKVEIATILAQNSDILLLDEPLNHLDISFRYKLMELLKKLSENKTIVIVTHDIQYVQQYCSNVMILLENNNTIIGTTSTIMTQENINLML